MLNFGQPLTTKNANNIHDVLLSLRFYKPLENIVATHSHPGGEACNRSFPVPKVPGLGGCVTNRPGLGRFVFGLVAGRLGDGAWAGRTAGFEVGAPGVVIVKGEGVGLCVGSRLDRHVGETDG